MRPTVRITAAAGAAALAFTLALTTATAADAAPSRATLPGSIPAWANSKALTGAAPAGDVVHARVYLPWRNQAQLDALTTAVSTPGNASYGKYLTAQQFHEQFAPAQADVVAVQQWLRDAGFTVVDTPDNDHYVAVEGTVDQAQSAFGTTLGLYTAYGQTLRAPEAAPTVPAAVAGKVSAVVGLDDSAKLIASQRTDGNAPAKQGHGAPGAGFRAGEPCAAYYGASTVTTDVPVYGDKSTPLAPCGYTPAQIRGLYGLTADDTGAGQTVAFVGANASPTLVQDVTTYSRKHGLPDPSIRQIVPPGVYRHPDTPQQVPGDFYGEETLDAESIHTTAPNAELLFVGSSNAYQDFDVSINHIVDRHLASIISISYGFGGEGVPQGFINALDKTFQQAVATGIGIYVSSGDSGDEIANTGTAQPDFYANDPNVTAVGGTSASIVPTSGTAPLVAQTSTREDGVVAPVYGGAGTPATAAAANWQRGFEVGWQTSNDPFKPGATISPSANGSPAYTLNGTLSALLPSTYTSGAGGGVSRVFARPAYQTAAGITTSGRAVPDISALADPNTGFLVGQTQQFPDGAYYDEYRIGGTSLAAPLMAGIAAVLNQKNGAPLGFLNPLIYRTYAGANRATAYYDVDQNDLFCGGDGCTAADPLPAVVRTNYADNVSAASGLVFSVRTQETPLTTLHTVRGYDVGSGVGTPNGNAFVAGILAAGR